ncbi:23S rRNA (adenine(2030)-N(6))-methyltransferase RlmJ [Alkalimarinus sediminis]|uniref:23S rRNA (Adenine(2030)-N(6))-methyltransferase RlmJ n=1 Tax=Alkalimarinus sediminis TaxID=1632866 RepID=A0A9E8HUJ3_9ALTE|nr:23S rRNA (adenine(2030)-N(6))-methyltransferase RlmJ [Alkalimarinus sediminis]UZW75989.1 23S rRNA (adenine(2030)-N(6))-methyltransferase RlmJ [Alkalimarinus sediminis]
MNQLYGRYRFSVGSLFDVHKHVVLTCAIEQLKHNTKCFHYIDAHAGAGLYDINSENASGNTEVGVEALLSGNKNEMTEKYVDIVRGFNSGLPLSKYPGSPMIARKLMRATDTLALIELNVDEYSELSSAFQQDINVDVDHGSAFDRVLKHIPAQAGQGLILIDPDYIIDEDSDDTANLIIQCRSKWPGAMIVVTLPCTGSSAKDRYVISILKDSGVTDLVVSNLEFAGDESESRSCVSRVLIVNPTHDIKNTIESVFSQMVSTLPVSIKAKSRVEAA